MSIFRLCFILGFIVTSYGVRWFLEEVEVAVTLLESGYTQRIIAECFDVSRSVVARLWRCYQETGEFIRREGQGRHRMTSQREDQYLRNLALQNWQYTARRLQIDFQHAIGQGISDQTILTDYMKVIWGPDVRQEGLFSLDNILQGYMSLPKNIRTGDRKTGVQFCSRMKQISPEYMWLTCLSLETTWRTIWGL